MESYLMITQINDFIFCPRSIFFSGVFRNSVSDDLYHQTSQIIGRINHETIDNGTYSTKKTVLTGLTVYAEKYNLLGCIDVFDVEKGLLTERKYSITAVYDGFRYQLYAQYFALTEMGYKVNEMRLYSKKDNKIYPIPLPTAHDIMRFEQLLEKIRSFSLDDPFDLNPNKCKNCVYNPLCDLQ